MEIGITEVVTTYRMLPQRNIFNICNLITLLMMASIFCSSLISIKITHIKEKKNRHLSYKHHGRSNGLQTYVRRPWLVVFVNLGYLSWLYESAL